MKSVAVQRGSALVGLVLVVALLAWAALGYQRGDVTSLAGTWILEGGGSLELPGLFASQGLPANGRVQVYRTAEVEHEVPHALWVARPQYQLGVSVDGRVVHEAPEQPEAGSTFVLLPPLSTGAHRITLDLTGALDEGGITGRIVFGPVRGIRHVAEHSEGLRVGLALGLGLLAFGHLAVGVLRRRSRLVVLYGAFLVTLAAFTLLTSDLATEWLSLVPQLRLRRLGYGLLSALGIAYLARFHDTALGLSGRGIMAVAMVTSVVGLVVAPAQLYRVEQLQDGVLLLAIAWSMWTAWRTVREGPRGPSLLLLATLVPVVLVAGLEMSITHGFTGGTSQMFVGILAFVSASSVVLALSDADEAERQRRLVVGAPDAMVFVGKDGQVLDANEPAERLLGDTGNLLARVKQADRPLVRAHLTRAGEQADRCEFQLEDGPPVESVATPLGETRLLVVRDITQRKRADEWLLQAARVETVAALVGGVARDFQETLSHLEEEMAALRPRAEGMAVERLDRMESTLDRARLLTRRLLAVAGGRSSELGPVDLTSVCRGAADLVEPTLSSGIRFTLDLPDLPLVYGAPSDLEHILVNLLFNARDAIGQQGMIHLAARSFDVDGARGVVVFVDDDGPGVPDHLKHAIFDPFMTTKQRGTGLGLAVSSQIIRDHLGQIWVEDVLGGGARFLVALRLAEDVSTLVHELPEGRDVLLVDDDADERKRYARALTRAGYDVIAVGDGSSAMEHLGDEAPDVVIADLVAPQVNGIELARACEAGHPDTSVILLGGFVGAGEGSDAWFRFDKPLRPERLVVVVGEARRSAEQGTTSQALPSFDELKSSTLGLDTL